MTKLAELQANFIKDCLSATLSKNKNLMAKDIDTSLISAQGLMGIYQNSSIANITNSLSLSYPVIEKLVGKDFFRASCKVYIYGHWPTSGNMDDYGEEFPQFLAELESVKQLTYLDDVAKLEWLFHQSSLAKDSIDFDWTTLANIVPSEAMKLNFLLAPSVALMKSTMPIDKIWLMNQINALQNTELSLDVESEVFILLFRQALKTEMIAITPSEFTLLQSFSKQQIFEVAIENATAIDANISIDNCLKKYIELGVICSFSMS